MDKLPQKVCHITEEADALTNLQAVFYDIFDQLEDGYFEIDLNGRFIFANQAVCEYYGKNIDELIGTRALAGMAPEYRKKIAAFFNNIFQKGTSDNFPGFEFIQAGGKTLILDLSIALIHNKNGEKVGFRGIVRERTKEHYKRVELKRYQEFADSIDDGFFETDLDGNLTFINPAICRIHGYRPNELIGMNHRELASATEAKNIFKVFNQIYNTGQPAKIIDYTILTKNGDIRNLEVSAKLIRDRNGEIKGFRGITRDRTEKKIQEQELLRYREFVESIDDGCFETDINGNITFANPAMCQIHGYPRQELIGMNHRDLAPAEDTKKIFKIFNLIYKTGIASRVFDYNILTKNDQIRNLEVSAKIIYDQQGKEVGFRGITRDRTEKKLQELELERYQQFVENVEDACFEVDLRGNFIFFNEATCRVFGYPPEQLMGMNNREYTSAETSKKIYNIFNKIYKTGRPADVFDYQIQRGDGELRYLDMSTSLITDEKGLPIGFRGICRDVTDQKKAQQENERLTALLNESQRLEAISTLAAGVAHNFNNLLMSIQGYVSLLFMGIEPDHPNYKRLQTIEAHIKKGSDLTLQLLNYANVNYNPARRVNINEIISAALSMFKITHKQIETIEKYDNAIQEAAVDRKQMEHVLTNLFKNAVQAMPDGGSLTIETGNVVLEDEFVKAYDRNPGPYVKIVIKDSGLGMDAATLERIFEPFFTTQNLGMATGLGLAAVYGVIKKHQGIIDVESQKGRGTTVTIYLPSKAELPQSQQEPPAAASNQKAILIVDDEEVFIKLINRMIGNIGYTILTATNGHDAMDIFRSHHERIELVIMDMIMPGIGGDQLIEMLQGINPEIRVILVSGYIKDDKMKKMTTHSRRAFLQKPFQQDALLETIDNLLTAKGEAEAG